MRLIVTADDYGFSKAINEGIEDCLRVGSVTAVSVMTNMPYWKEIHKVLEHHPGVSIGIHWTVSQGKPTLPREVVPSLVNSSGDFWKKREFQRRFILGKINKKELFEELRSQFNLLNAEGCNVAFWNTHQNAHLYLFVFWFFCARARKLKISATRTARIFQHKRIGWKGFWGNPVLGFKNLALNFWHWVNKIYGFKTPDGILALSEKEFTLENLDNILSSNGNRRSVEIFAHPARSFHEIEGMTYMTDSRVSEWQVLSSPDVLKVFETHKVQLINNSEL